MADCIKGIIGDFSMLTGTKDGKFCGNGDLCIMDPLEEAMKIRCGQDADGDGIYESGVQHDINNIFQREVYTSNDGTNNTFDLNSGLFETPQQTHPSILRPIPQTNATSISIQISPNGYQQPSTNQYQQGNNGVVVIPPGQYQQRSAQAPSGQPNFGNAQTITITIPNNTGAQGQYTQGQYAQKQYQQGQYQSGSVQARQENTQTAQAQFQATLAEFEALMKEVETNKAAQVNTKPKEKSTEEKLVTDPGFHEYLKERMDGYIWNSRLNGDDVAEYAKKYARMSGREEFKEISTEKLNTAAQQFVNGNNKNYNDHSRVGVVTGAIGGALATGFGGTIAGAVGGYEIGNFISDGDSNLSLNDLEAYEEREVTKKENQEVYNIIVNDKELLTQLALDGDALNPKDLRKALKYSHREEMKKYSDAEIDAAAGVFIDEVKNNYDNNGLRETFTNMGFFGAAAYLVYKAGGKRAKVALGATLLALGGSQLANDTMNTLFDRNASARSEDLKIYLEQNHPQAQA